MLRNVTLTLTHVTPFMIAADGTFCEITCTLYFDFGEKNARLSMSFLHHAIFVAKFLLFEDIDNKTKYCVTKFLWIGNIDNKTKYYAKNSFGLRVLTVKSFFGQNSFGLRLLTVNPKFFGQNSFGLMVLTVKPKCF